jgi:streptogramin lyase
LKTLALAVVALVLVAAVAGSAYYLGYFSGTKYSFQATGCNPFFGGARIERSQLNTTGFGVVTKYTLPAPNRFPNGILALPDGSVWFGEEAAPAVAHLFVNGSLVEYLLPTSYAPSASLGHTCGFKTDIWSIAVWQGRVWVGDTSGNDLASLDPKTGAFSVVDLPVANSYPSWLTVGPDGNLWITQVLASMIGRVSPTGSVTEYRLPTGIAGTPWQILFANSTLGYYVDAGQSAVPNAGIYRFDPGDFSPVKVGSGMPLYAADSITLGFGGIWTAEHNGASVAFYNMATDQWTTYPTQQVNYSAITLPYFVKSNGTAVWFNEHYGNRMAFIDPAAGSLTEYALSDPLPTRLNEIGNIQTFSVGAGKVWFTQFTGNSVGFVDSAAKLNFSASSPDNRTVTLQPGESKTFTFDVAGRSAVPLSVKFSDSEDVFTQLRNLTASSSVGYVPPFSGSASFTFTVGAGALRPGRYMLAATVTDGLLSRSLYFTIVIP